MHYNRTVSIMFSLELVIGSYKNNSPSVATGFVSTVFRNSVLIVSYVGLLISAVPYIATRVKGLSDFSVASYIVLSV